MISNEIRDNLVFILIISLFKLALSESTVIQPYDICQSYSGRRIYLDSNERGFLRTNNSSSSTYKNVFKLVFLIRLILLTQICFEFIDLLL